MNSTVISGNHRLFERFGVEIFVLQAIKRQVVETTLWGKPMRTRTFW